MDYLSLAGENLLFGFVITAVGFILGYLLYSKVVLRQINLKDALFEKDNFAAWIEFVGAFVFPVLFLSSKAVEGAASSNIWLDLASSAIYAAAYVIVFALLRYFHRSRSVGSSSGCFAAERCARTDGAADSPAACRRRHRDR